MRLKHQLLKHLPNFMLSRLSVDPEMRKFAFNNALDVGSDIQRKYGYNGDLLDIFSKNESQAVHKWHHYIPLYDRYFSSFRKERVRFLEIGVSKGGSLQMWRRYFGEDALIFGIDIDPSCAKLDGIAGHVRIGSQDDPNFLDSVINEMGGVDIILDDGSHKMNHIQSSFKFLFPKLNDGGIYIIEDLHTAYWRSFGGGYHSENNFFRFVLDIVNDMHHWYHTAGMKYPNVSSFCHAIHIHDSMAAFEKAVTHEPTHSEMS